MAGRPERAWRRNRQGKLETVAATNRQAPSCQVTAVTASGRPAQERAVFSACRAAEVAERVPNGDVRMEESSEYLPRAASADLGWT